jgi:HPt (histidine-containing phosphotransfer) domain-containing protein
MSDNPLVQKSKIDSLSRGDFGKPVKPEDSNASQDAAANRDKLQSLLAGLWDRSRQTVVERIEILQEAKSLATDRRLDEPARLRAVDSAHKLAGVLGTFGLPHGTELAREAEQVFGQEAVIGPADLERLGALLTDLASLVRTANTYPGMHPGR